jgi:hypothetical protein
MARKRKRGTCVHCGAEGPISEDHVPPQNLFPKPRGALPWVPSCDACNHGASQDDEYFRLMLTLSEQAGRHPAVLANSAAVHRSLRMPEKAGLRRMLLANTFQVERKTPSGLYAGKAPAYRVDLNRLNRVVARVVRGMYFLETGERVPDSHLAIAISTEGLSEEESGTSPDYYRDVIAVVLRNRQRMVGENVMSYWMAFSEDDPYTSAWVLEFYGAMRFYGGTVEREVLAGNKKAGNQ